MKIPGCNQLHLLHKMPSANYLDKCPTFIGAKGFENTFLSRIPSDAQNRRQTEYQKNEVSEPFETIKSPLKNWKTTPPQVLDEVDSEKMRAYHEFLTKEPHIAALKRDQRLVEWMVDEWKSSGLDSVELATYDMYLSWPNQSDPNRIWLKANLLQ